MQQCGHPKQTWSNGKDELAEYARASAFTSVAELVLRGETNYRIKMDVVFNPLYTYFLLSPTPLFFSLSAMNLMKSVHKCLQLTILEET